MLQNTRSSETMLTKAAKQSLPLVPTRRKIRHETLVLYTLTDPCPQHAAITPQQIKRSSPGHYVDCNMSRPSPGLGPSAPDPRARLISPDRLHRLPDLQATCARCSPFFRPGRTPRPILASGWRPVWAPSDSRRMPEPGIAPMKI